jgi:hypothetical protein
LDLKDCELAVLSACETGRGQVAGGEGVIGLQRAFHEAGARRVVASLWKVDDEATRNLMNRFYTFLWRDGLDPVPALHAAQLELLRGQVEPKNSRGLGAPEASRAARSGGRTHPRLWAAWVISGRPQGSLPGPLNQIGFLQRIPALFDGIDRRHFAVGAAVLFVVPSVASVAWLRSRRRRPAGGHANGSAIVGTGGSD